MISLLLAAFAAASIDAPVHVAAPVGKWVLGRGDDVCRATHNYSVAGTPVLLGLEPALTDGFLVVRLQVAGPPNALRQKVAVEIGQVRSRAAEMDIDILAPTGKTVYQFTLPEEEYRTLRQARELSVTSQPINARFSVPDLPEVDALLASCVSDLLEGWGFSKREQSRIAQHPRPADGSGLISADDYPDDALNAGAQGRAGVLLHIDAGGRVTKCQVVSSSGHPSLDRRTCEIYRERAKWMPARDPAGNAVPGVSHKWLTWLLG